MSLIAEPEPTAATPVDEGPVDQGAGQRAGRFGALRYLGKRAGFYLVTAVAAVTLNFVIPRFMPGDPAKSMLLQIQRQSGTVPTDSEAAAIRALYGDPTKNILGQYADYLGHLLRLDFGLSTSNYPSKVSDLIATALPWTLALVGVTTLLAWGIGTALGAYVGWRPGSRGDSVLTVLSTFLHSLPAFWLALLMAGWFAFSLRWFPSAGGYDPDVPFQINNVWFLLSVLKYGALPAFTLVLIGFSGWLFTMRNVMVTTVTEDYVQLARAKGLPERTVMFRYAARNALLPNVTGLAHAIGAVIGGVVLTEIVFTYPGMGYLLVQAISAKDFPVMQTIFLMITVATLVANFLADSAYVLLDPRTREEA